MNKKKDDGGAGREEAPIVLYTTPDGAVKVNVLFRDGNLWLPQAGIAELFGVQKAAVSRHLKNIFAEGELPEQAVVSKMETTAADGKRYGVTYYGIKAIIAVGYRVNWLTAEQLQALFQASRQDVAYHIEQIYADGELPQAATCKKFLQVRQQGNRTVKRTFRSRA